MLPSLDLGASVTMLGYGFIGFGFKRPGRFSDFKRLPFTLPGVWAAVSALERMRGSLLRRSQIRENEKEVSDFQLIRDQVRSMLSLLCLYLKSRSI